MVEMAITQRERPQTLDHGHIQVGLHHVLSYLCRPSLHARSKASHILYNGLYIAPGTILCTITCIYCKKTTVKTTFFAVRRSTMLQRNSAIAQLVTDHDLRGTIFFFLVNIKHINNSLPRPHQTSIQRMNKLVNQKPEPTYIIPGQITERSMAHLRPAFSPLVYQDGSPLLLELGHDFSSCKLWFVCLTTSLSSCFSHVHTFILRLLLLSPSSSSVQHETCPSCPNFYSIPQCFFKWAAMTLAVCIFVTFDTYEADLKHDLYEVYQCSTLTVSCLGLHLTATDSVIHRNQLIEFPKTAKQPGQPFDDPDRPLITTSLPPISIHIYIPDKTTSGLTQSMPSMYVTDLNFSFQRLVKLI